MHAEDFIAILPLLILTGTPIVVMAGIAIRRSHAASIAITVIGIVAALASVSPASAAAPRQVTAILLIDSYALFFTGLILAATLATAVLSYGYLERHDLNRDEMYVLLLIATLGAAVLASSTHFVSFFLGLELLSLPLYGMIAYLRRGQESFEAGIKYLILAAAAAAFLLFGMALVYSELGTLAFGAIDAKLAVTGATGLLIPAMAPIVTGIGFKLAVVPFHMWTPDVYQGAPAPVTAYIATVSKGAMVALLMRYFFTSGAAAVPHIQALFAVIAIASMLAGNLLALMQTNVKRLLAYSSIAHLGYILVAFESGGPGGMRAVAFYLVAYFVTILGAFGVVTVLSDADHDAEEMEEYRGLFWRRPVLACILAAMLFSLAGMPLTAGFVAKFFAVASGASAALWMQILVLVITSGIGVFYYLRVILAVFAAETGARHLAPSLTPGAGVVLGVLSAALLWLGIFPSPMLTWIDAAVLALR
jgi:NADH-quinone oxidoreductase subunit N